MDKLDKQIVKQLHEAIKAETKLVNVIKELIVLHSRDMDNHLIKIVEYKQSIKEIERE